MAVRASDLLTLAVLPSPSYVRQYYRKQASTLSPPSAPTTNPPAAPWSTIEPAYTSGSTDTLYTVMLTAYGSVAFEYGPVQKSSSFEAAKQAYNRSDSAVSAAQDAQEAADDAAEDAAAAQDKANALAARGDNLVTNGSAELGDTTNWSSGVELAIEQTPSGFPGAFGIGTVGRTVLTLEKIPVDRTSVYRMSMWIKAPTSSYHYTLINMYDVDGAGISPQHVDPAYKAKLARALAPGDTTVLLDNGSAWPTSMTAGFYLGIWPYTTTTGPVYQIDDGYTRKVYSVNGATRSGNTITLPGPWAGPSVAIGGDVGITRSGGSYMYPVNKLKTHDGWELYEGLTSPFRPGTALVAVGGLLNYQTRVSGETYFTGVRFINDNARQEASAAQRAADDAQAKADKAEQDAADAHALAGTADANATIAFTRAGTAETNAKSHADTVAGTAKTQAIAAAATDATTKATNAKNDAIASSNALPKIFHSGNSPAGTAPENSTWFKHKLIAGGAFGAVIGQWTMQQGSWRPNSVDASILANLHVGYLTAGTALIDTAVLNKVWSELGVFTRLTVGAGGAWIDGTVIKDSSVDAKHITATESMTTKIFGAEYGVIKYLTSTQKATFLAGLDAIGESWIDGVNIKDKAITAALMNFVTSNGVNRLRLDDNGILLDRISGARPIFKLDESGLKTYDPRVAGKETWSVDPQTGLVTAIGMTAEDINATGTLSYTKNSAKLGIRDGLYGPGLYAEVDGQDVGSIQTGPGGISMAGPPEPNGYAGGLDIFGSFVEMNSPIADALSNISGRVRVTSGLAGDGEVEISHRQGDIALISGWNRKVLAGRSRADLAPVVTQGEWKFIPLRNGWSAFGQGFPSPQYRIEGDLVRFRGILNGAIATTAMSILPSEAQPIYNQLLNATAWSSQDAPYRLNVASDGTMSQTGLTGSVAWISLDNITYPLT